MRIQLYFGLFCSIFSFFAQAEPHPLWSGREWELDSTLAAGIVPHSEALRVEGVQGHALQLDGQSILELKDSAHLNTGADGFSVSVWFNPFALEAGQQMIAGKNRYSLNERQWSLTVEPDGRLKAHLRQGGWSTILCQEPLKAGAWHCAVLVVNADKGTLYLNGKLVGEVALAKPLPVTKAPITLGGIWDAGKVRQAFFGALDEFRYEPRAVPTEEIADRYEPATTTLPIPEPPVRFPLWDESKTLAAAADLPELEGVEFHVIKKWDKPADGYTFLHGVGLASHKGKLYASIGHNKGGENTVTEEAQYRVSEDDGKTWGPLQVIDAGDEPENLAISHGVFLSREGTLWAFHGAYYGKMENIHTRAYSLDEATGEWRERGVVAENGFWALNQPVKMNDGNWVMSGGSFGLYSNDRVFPAAVAISHGDDFTKWDFVRIEPSAEIKRMWGESSLIVDGPEITNIARYGGGAQALVATSEDFGRTWTESQVSNLPMATSKPASGMLSTGQRYLVCTTADKNGGKRTPLTIAFSRPGKKQFSKVSVIRRSEHDAPGESANALSLSYPCAIEHGGKLYVGFSNNGGRKGNLNSAELAVIPIGALAVE